MLPSSLTGPLAKLGCLSVKHYGFYTERGELNTRNETMITSLPTERWSYFEPNWNWSVHALISDAALAEIARATVIPFLIISALEAFVHCSQYTINVSIFLANKIYSTLPPKIERVIYFLLHDCFRHRNHLR